MYPALLTKMNLPSPPGKRYVTLLVYLMLSFVVVIYFCKILPLSYDKIPPESFVGRGYGPYTLRYLNSVAKLSEVPTLEFNQKLAALKKLDILLQPKSTRATFGRHPTADPFALIRRRCSAGVFAGLTSTEKAQLYGSVVLPESEYAFKPVPDKLFMGLHNETAYLEKKMWAFNELSQRLTDSELTKLGLSNDTEIVARFKQRRNAMLRRNRIVTLQIKHIIRHMKIFSSLYLKDSGELMSGEDMLCASASRSLFPWITGEKPAFFHIDSANKRIPVQLPQDTHKCMLKNIASGMEGRGVVITLSDEMVPELAALFSILRSEWSKKQYPIQLFFMGDTLSQTSMERLAQWATGPTNDDMPPLDVTFANVTEAIAPKYRKNFGRFGMKLLAYLFNTFEELLMMDTDTVPFVDLDTFFGLRQYKASSTLFFRDRESSSRLSVESAELLKKTLLNKRDERQFLRINAGGGHKVTSKLVKDRFFEGRFRHLMEFGLFAINRTEKFDGVVMSAVLQLLEPIKSAIHGEKEMIWLGQEMTGNEYLFNENYAAAVGELIADRQKDGPSLCSSHPGHLSDDKSELLWMNSGFLVCKKSEAFYNDGEVREDYAQSLKETKDRYESPIRIRQALIPPSPLNADDSSNDRKFGNGWRMTGLCDSYIWCAYDTIPGHPEEKAEVISLETEETDRMDILGKLWVKAYNEEKEQEEEVEFADDEEDGDWE